MALAAPIGCSEKLDTATAERLIAQDYASRDGARCTWRNPVQVTNEIWGFMPFEPATAACAEQLADAGLLEIGPCHEGGCGDCCKQLLKAKGDAVFVTSRPAGLDFKCGDIELGGVTSISTEGNKATVKFRRTFKPGPILEQLSACKLERPIAGTAESTREFRRDDAGRWGKP